MSYQLCAILNIYTYLLIFKSYDGVYELYENVNQINNLNAFETCHCYQIKKNNHKKLSIVESEKSVHMNESFKFSYYIVNQVRIANTFYIDKMKVVPSDNIMFNLAF